MSDSLLRSSFFVGSPTDVSESVSSLPLFGLFTILWKWACSVKMVRGCLICKHNKAPEKQTLRTKHSVNDDRTNVVEASSLLVPPKPRVLFEMFISANVDIALP